MRQSLDTALERLESVPLEGRKKPELREGIATGYEKYSRAKSEDQRQYCKGVIAGMEWAAGLREKF